ncbi:hypothetical protein M409DRAFT_62376 [Zasmidium cellare ATCC 36951]|uniref:FAD-binding domain-containing protein n=1 Tax=Zasmidium cellare ATCC 36951 TaxID=1080233 RepID=A0A6A6D093_ZASCE|nr:uncharacterized protein M409DRAFT_62376 [Zasmidium cellare ATCC 36951]KAF2172605.1 hypothetical protein M409DRAFT_62376 [Zasmidium cellare ATCC 36951]
MAIKDPPSTNNPAKLHVAIVGAGIAGVTLALGLLSRGISVTIYERGASFREIGAGIGFTSNAERAMKILDPQIHAAFKRVTVQNGTDWFMWMDGMSEDCSLIHKMYLGERGFEGCHRAEFLDELVRLMPDGIVRFGKTVDRIEEFEWEDERPVHLKFTDGSVECADVVIGCDGIRSRVRQLLLGADNPASYPTYSHKYAFRGLIPMHQARAALGVEKTDTRHMYLGKDSHALTFPVAGGQILNVVAFTSDSHDWPFPEKFTSPAAKADAVQAFSGFNSTVRSIIDLLPEQLDKWAVFDTYDNPPPAYSKGRICLAGDSAHAAAPYHGAGAGFAIEDGAVLAHLLSAVSSDSRKDITAALQAYDSVRRERAQWLVETSRFVGEMYQWQDKRVGSDLGKCAEEIEWRSRKIWDYDVEQMVLQSERAFTRELM